MLGITGSEDMNIFIELKLHCQIALSIQQSDRHQDLSPTLKKKTKFSLKDMKLFSVQFSHSVVSDSLQSHEP